MDFKSMRTAGPRRAGPITPWKRLYKLGRRKDGDAILFPMLEGFEKGGFQGFGPNGMTYDWKAWDGTAHGYEGLLVDGYQALLAVLSR